MAAKKSTARTAATKKVTPAKGAAGTTANGAAKTAKAAVKKSTAKKSTAKQASASKSAAKKPAAKKPAAKKSVAKKAPAAKKSTVKKASATKPRAQRLVVREDESPWTKTELKAVRVELEEEIARLRRDLEASETELTAFLREPLDGAGDDQADAGAKSFEREHELSLVAGARTGLKQNLHALERLDDGTYGVCESCGNPIGKLRLQAYPRATLCMTCKSTQERR